jgi:hypothetical protein
VTAIRAPAPAELAGPSPPAPLGVGSFEGGDPALRQIASAAVRSLALAVIAGLLILVALPVVLVAAAGQ